jgi:hypothetical protein
MYLHVNSVQNGMCVTEWIGRSPFSIGYGERMANPAVLPARHVYAVWMYVCAEMIIITMDLLYVVKSVCNTDFDIRTPYVSTPSTIRIEKSNPLVPSF